MRYLDEFNTIIFIFLTALYSYQFLYILVSLFHKYRTKHEEPLHKLHKYAVAIAARNEETVIGHLIESINKQSYPKDLISIFVVADNCTDKTAQIAKDLGANVYERFNQFQVGKGYALDFLFNKITDDYGKNAFDGYFIFDADNLLDKNYIVEMNKVFDSGYTTVTSYRNSKNYDTNWITAGYSLWFLREARFLNYSRMALHTSCAISGTGFLISNDIVQKQHGWKYFLLTEDIEFSVSNAIDGELIGYCETAKLYDEQPASFIQSWNQRLRWSKGFYQVTAKYGWRLIKSIFVKPKKNLACYDMLMTIAPATLVSLFCVGVNLAMLLTAIDNIYLFRFFYPVITKNIFLSLANCYCVLFLVGLLTTITEWKEIRCSAFKKILYVFTFPVFIFTYVPISIAALFTNVKWKPITHSVAKTVEDMK